MSGEASSAPIAAGDLLANGRYRVEEVLGEGGMGVVCAATHVALGQRVAVKFLLPEALEHPQAVARFEREARASASMTSEHVVRVTDVGFLESGAPYFVMEFLEGEDLAQRLRRKGPLDVRTGLALMAQACEGLIEAHAKGLVHRDIKPSNLFLARRASGKSVLKVIDFGIAKAELSQESGGHDLTRTSEIMGSPQYMSPEQLRDTRNVDARTDIWSLGAAFYECLTGRPPFVGETITELVVRIATEAPPTPALVRPDLPAGVSALLERCLAKKLTERFASAAELLEAIEAYRGSVSSLPADRRSSSNIFEVERSGAFPAFDVTASGVASTSGPSQDRTATVERGAPSIAGKQKAPVVVLLAVALAVVAGAALFLRGRDEPRAHAPEPAPPPQVAASSAPAPEVAAPPPSPPASPSAPTPAQAPAKEIVASSNAAVTPPVGAAKAPARPVRAPEPGARAEVVAAPVVAPAPAPKPQKESEAKRKYDPGFE